MAADILPDRIVRHIFEEWRWDDPAVEIGHTLDGRWRLGLQRSCGGDSRGLDLTGDSVVIVTGGARGVTASVALALAERHRLRLVLVGRSPMPAPEPPATRNIEKLSELRRFLIDDLRANSSNKVTPAQIDRVLKRLVENREIQTNLAAMRAHGADVEYHAADVRDGEAFERLIDVVYAKWGRIDGVIHGAGIIDDKSIHEKSLQSFEAVYATKVAPALAMARKLRPDTLKFVVFFSSVAARFGNAGQSDYSAANEVLNKLAARLSRAWSKVHIVSINWGPWAGGMASDELLRLYASRNIHPMIVAAGVSACLEELGRGACGETEIVVSESLDQIAGTQPGKGHNAEESKDLLTPAAG
jgi:NAD(P)-dependent dehydrogenase (short-subunit alcohol dehydrogenase family)